MNVEKRGRGVSRKTQLRIRTMVWKVQALTKGFKLDTHVLRERMILQLEALFEMANERALDCHPKQWKEKQNWARIAGYVSQVINSLGKTYDLKKIGDKLDDLATLLSKVKEENEAKSEKP